jgi:streptomycin 6-kinase
VIDGSAAYDSSQRTNVHREELVTLVPVGDQIGPLVDDEVRHRLSRRYGSGIGSWLDALPARLQELAWRWRLDLGPFVRRGTVSVVLNCRDQAGTPVILKVSPDHQRIVTETRALAAWHTRHVPHVIASDEAQGALLMEAIQPGTALDESGQVPGTSALADLVHALHQHAPPSESVPRVEERIASLYRSGEANYARRPDLQDVIPRPLYERGRRAANTLAAEACRPVVLHGDLTPANVLDGGAGRGLVAVDPAPCWGDPAFDSVDLLMWRADDLTTLSARARDLGDRVGFAQERALRWCAAFAAMVALELAEAALPGEPPSTRLTMLVDLASAS